MAATVVYEGVTGGDLFAGMKFYLLQRIPLRNTWTDLITANGGQVVQIEKLADIVIADHARKDSPPGSISWTFIEQSVKEGSLRDIEDHRAGPGERTVRDVASGQPARKGKVFFTEEDDRILMEWCTRAEQKGIPVKGNELFKQLEFKNNRHPWQSWRDRWVKHVSFRPRPGLSEDKEDQSDEDVLHHVYSSSQIRSPVGRRPIPKSTPRSAQKPAPGRTKGLSRSAAKSSGNGAATGSQKVLHKTTSSSQSPTHPYITKSSGGNVFTDEETQLLEAEYDAIMNLNDDQVIDAWMAWASAHSSHTPQEWRNYFKEYVVPKKQAKSIQKRRSSISPPALESPKCDVSKSVISMQGNPNDMEIKDSQDSSRQNLSYLRAQKKSVDPTLIDESLFQEDLTALADYLELEVEFNPVICGRTISLFTLWQIVKSPEFGGFDAVTGNNLWSNVADRLGFNISRHSSVASDLKHCYSEILADFENVRAEYEEEPAMTDSQEKDMIENQLFELAEHETSKDPEEDKRKEEVGEEEHDDLDYPQISSAQPIPSSSSKRSFGADRSNKNFTYSKRQRVDKGKGKETEIPSTPEDIINNNQMFRPSHQPSPLKVSTSRTDGSFSESDEIPIKPINFNPSKPSRAQTAVAEPETQDFRFQPKLNPAEDQDDSSSFVERSSPPILPRIIPERVSGSSSAMKDSIYSTNSHDDSSTQSQSDSQRDTAIEAYITRQVALGYTVESVIEALDHTTLEYGSVAESVMESLLVGEGIPQNLPGVWTTLDDDALVEPANSKELQRVLKKHGAKRTRKRKRYLREKSEITIEAGSHGDIR